MDDRDFGAAYITFEDPDLVDKVGFVHVFFCVISFNAQYGMGSYMVELSLFFR